MSLIERLRANDLTTQALAADEAADRIEELEKANAQLNHDIGEYVDKTAELEAEIEWWKARVESGLTAKHWPEFGPSGRG